MSTFNDIICADCNDALPQLPAESVDLVLTDPPYGVRYQDRQGRTVANDDNLSSVLGSFKQLYRVLRPNTFCISFYGWPVIDQFFAAWTAAGFRPVGHLVFAKDYASRETFLRYTHEQAFLLAKGSPQRPAEPIDDVQRWTYSGNRMHPTEKAVATLLPLIRSFSQVGGVVLDPFAGVGSSLIAAALAGRRYLGIELEAKYVGCARRRLAGVARALARPAA